MMDRAGTLRFAFLAIAYVLAGSISPILVELAAMNGAGDPSTMLVLLPSCLGMSLSIFTNHASMSKGKVDWRSIIALAVLELASARLTNQGLIDAGSTIYTIAHCSGTIFTAIFAVLLLKRHINIAQWSGIAVITGGLCVMALGMQSQGDAVVDGVILILLGTMLHSLGYIVIEHTLLEADDPISPEFLCALLGMAGVVLNLLWQCVYTIPHFDTLVALSVEEAGGEVFVILLAYAGLVVAACVSATCFYNLVSQAGCASTGVIKGLQAVLTFVTSHFAFCGLQPAQCFTPLKGASLCIVLLGVLIYSASTTFSSQRHRGCSADDGTLLSTHAYSALSTDTELEMTPILTKELDKAPRLPRGYSYGSYRTYAVYQQDHPTYRYTEARGMAGTGSAEGKEDSAAAECQWATAELLT
jgi:drug/metabolite transporter (DMT)-like permease